MGKIVKFCSNCDEGFPEKFGFCPNCSSALEAFEMSPLGTATPLEASRVPETPAFIEPIQEPVQDAPVEEIHADAAEEAIETKAVAAPAETVEAEEASAAPFEEEPETETVIKKAATAVPAASPIFAQTRAVDADARPLSLEEEHSRAQAEGAYYLTVMEEKNVGTRAGLLVGTFGFMIAVLMGALVYNIFSKDLEVGSINDDVFNAVIVDDTIMETEQEQQQKKDKDAGGGGGGGREEKEETTQGDLADQSKNPTRPPDAKVPRFDDFQLQTPPPQTEGNKTFEKKYEVWGDPNGRFANFSNGTGSGGGQGSGVGTGQGSGRGTGAGSGNGSGFGGGNGPGNGNGNGGGNEGLPGGPPPDLHGVTQPIKILSKPRPGYTDSARQANIQGTVILRVTFNANGSIGGISAVKGLPNGLTEQAIAAARNIRFEPAKNNGIGQTVTKQIEYTFSIY
ncbi:MAG: TonB family protein [Acidobacteria bacterium]|nr:TonB family protein [Acidobacteriota bacterium]